MRETYSELLAIVESTDAEKASGDDTTKNGFGNGITKENLLNFLGTKVGKIYQNLMVKHTDNKSNITDLKLFRDQFVEEYNKYVQDNELDKIEINTKIDTCIKTIGTPDDFKLAIKED